MTRMRATTSTLQPGPRKSRRLRCCVLCCPYYLAPGYSPAAAERGCSTTPRARAFTWIWQGLAAALVTTVFAAAVAQARSVASGVRAAQHLLVASMHSIQTVSAKLAQQRSVLSAQVDAVQRLALAQNAEGQWLLNRLDVLNLAAASTPIIGPNFRVSLTESF